VEKEVVWTTVAQKDFWEIVSYLSEVWPKPVLDRFHVMLAIKIKLLQKQPEIGFKSGKYSKYRRTLVNRHYVLLYTANSNRILIHRLKHIRMK
jgi:addiction module RelE/StbE family toxin